MLKQKIHDLETLKNPTFPPQPARPRLQATGMQIYRPGHV